jgi:soluble lytic murein transglycosylase-like protein
MLVEPGNSAAGSAPVTAIRQASQATGTSFNYLLATAQVESGLNPQAAHRLLPRAVCSSSSSRPGLER